MLSQRDLQILALMCAGLCNKQIANELKLSLSTVEKRRSRAMSYFQKNRLVVVQYVLRHAPDHGVVPLVCQFTQRQLDVMYHVAAGLSNDQIANAMQIAVSTAEKHISAIFAQSGFRNRFQIMLWVVRNGICRDKISPTLNESEVANVV
jgi:DNA-binding NarL/FixJ family response regulator